jgi:hypothetical protein
MFKKLEWNEQWPFCGILLIEPKIIDKCYDKAGSGILYIDIILLYITYKYSCHTKN